MATSLEFAQFVCEQIRGNYFVRHKKMFGEYMIYVNDKPILLVCDNTVFVKKAEEIKDIMCDAEVGTPYDGAREHYLLDVENHELLNEVIAVLEPITPVPIKKPRKKNSADK